MPRDPDHVPDHAPDFCAWRRHGRPRRLWQLIRRRRRGNIPGLAGRRYAAPGTGPACSLDATIYDVRLAPEQIGRLDPQTLTKAAGTPATFEAALAELGTSRPLYRASQSVRLGGDMITIGTEAPFVSNSRITDAGQTINSVQYSSIGAIFGIAGRPVRARDWKLTCALSSRHIPTCATTISNTVRMPMFRKATMSHKGIVQAQQPFVLMSIDASSLDANGKAVAYVTRVTLGAARGGGGIGSEAVSRSKLGMPRRLRE